MGADINCNYGVMSKKFSDKLRPHGVDNRNIKGRELLYLYKANNLKFDYHISSIIIISHIDSLTIKSQHTCWTILYDATNYPKVLVTANLQN